MKKLKRSSRRRSRSNDIERLENRQLLSATLVVNQSLMAFNAVRNSALSPVETLTLTNSGDATLTLGSSGVTIVNDPGNSFSGTNDAARFTVFNAGSIPATLAPGESFGLQLQYGATSATRNAAILDLTTNDPINPLQQVSLSGIGTTGTGGTNQPSLARILRAYHIPTYTGEGFQDAAEATDSTYPNPPDASSEEQVLQRLVKAGPGPVTIQVLASFTAAGTKPYTLGLYTPGEPNNDLHELLYTPTSENQTVFVHPQGATSFDPGSSPFGFYFVTNVQVKGRLGYSEDAFNTWDATNQRKFRFFPMERPDRSIVPNAFVMTSTEWNAPVGYDFTNIVAIVSNVMAAPSAPAAPVLGLQDLNAVPGSNTMLFNRIQNPNPTSGIIDQVHDTGTLRINNTGGSDLVISSISLSSPAWTLVSPPAFPLTVSAGSSFDLSIKFVATTAPAHPYNETNSPSFPNGGGVYNGSVTINSNDPNTSSKIVPLAGWWQQQSENNDEPSLQSLVNLMNGWGTTINPAAGVPELTESGTTPTYYGEEEPFGPNRSPTITPAPPTYWTVADAAYSVSVRQLSSWHTQGNTVQTWWFNQGSFSTHSLFTTSADYGQTLFPVLNGTTTPAANSFSPGTAVFGFKVDSEWSDDTKNNTSGGGHHIRFYPLRDASGQFVPNTYIMGMDYAVSGSQNFDFQDNVYVISNIKPATILAAPTDLYGVGGNGSATLQWAPVPGTVQSYNIYRSLAPSSGFALLTSGLTSTSYVDNSAPPGTQVYYRVSALNNGLESLASTAAVTTTGTPAGSLQSIDIAAVPTGSTSVDTTNPANPIYTVVAGGPGATGNSDGFRYLFEQQSGDFDVRLQVSSLTVAGSFSTAGLMARTSLNANSANVYMSASPVNYRFKSRSTTGGTTTITAGANTAFPGAWVRLRRVGNVFTGFSSADGVNWTQLKQVSVTLPSTVFLGLAVASNNTTNTTTAQMSSFGPAFTGPVANADTFNVTANTSTPLDIFANDTDATGTIDRTSVVLSTPNQGGSVAFNPSTGLIDYTPASGFVGTETFTYTVSDNTALTSGSATVTVIVAPTGPTAHDDQFTTIAGQALPVNVVANDTDTTGTIDPTTVAIVTAPDQGGAAVVDHTNGMITYTPAAGFIGSETFTYIVGDSNGLTATATVTMLVTSSPGAPVANPDNANTAVGQSVQINVLSNDVPDLTSGSALDPASVVTSDSANGGSLQLDPTTGIINYTPPLGFSGTDTFTYTVSDLSGHTSNSATVTVTVTPNGPVTADDSATAITGSSTKINVLNNDSSTAPLNPASVAVASVPSHGAAVANADGTITYTPAAGFVGRDSFTYTVANNNGSTSNTAVVSVDVGMTISSARGATHVLSWTDGDGTTALLTLNSGSANLFFTNGGTVTTTPAGRGTIGGGANAISRMTISGTTAASVLVLRGTGGNGLVALPDVSSTTPLASIIAPAASLSGTFNIAGLGVLLLGNASGAHLTIGNAGTPAGVVIVGGAMADSSLNSSVPIRVMRVASWSDTANNSSISAPLIATLISLGGFNAALNLSGSGSALPTLGVAQVVGAIGGDSWAINGRANTIVAGSITSAWSGTLAGLLNVIVDRGGSFASNLSAGGIGTMLVIGDVNGGAAITAASANVIRVTGSVANSTITMNGPASATPSLRAIIVGNAITGSTIATTGDITAMIAGSLAGSTITAGVDGGVTTIDAVTPGNIGSHAIRSLRLTARTAGAFAGSTVIAHTITTAALGDVNTNNNGTPEGVAAVAFTSLTATVGGIRVAPSRTQLQDAGQLSAYFSDKGVNLGDFRVDIVT